MDTEGKTQCLSLRGEDIQGTDQKSLPQDKKQKENG